MKRHLLTLILTLLFSLQGLAQADIYEDLSSAFRDGDQKNIAKYFNSKVELTIIQQSNVYSKTQAEMVMRDFFAKYPPVNFEFKHKGSSGQNSKFAIGLLDTQQGNFRVYFFVRQQEGNTYLQEMRFELDPNSTR
jgi:hypothetical protein